MSTIQDQENADKFKGKVTNKSIKYLLNQHITENKKSFKWFWNKIFTADSRQA